VSRRVLVARADNMGDVLLTGPAVRAVAASGAEVVFLCGPGGEAAARALPGVTEVVVCRLAWIDADPEPVDRATVESLLARLESLRLDDAVIFTSFHQSALPLALLLRMACVGRISAISVDYPGSLLDVRHSVPDDIHEVERSLSLAAAAGFHLPPGDDGRLAVTGRCHEPGDEAGPVVIHAGASVPARAWEPHRLAELVTALTAAGRRVVLTGGPAEAGLTASIAVAGRPALVEDRAGRTDFAELTSLIASASVVVCGNTGPAHLASAVGTPVVSIYAPTVPAVRWRPWRVPHMLLGDQDIACAGCRARICPVAGHPCVATVTAGDVLAAVETRAPSPVGAP
jgi:ADP-heptose:LPS heptosyltransferase